MGIDLDKKLDDDTNGGATSSLETRENHKQERKKLQKELETANQNLKTAKAALKKANEEKEKAEKTYSEASHPTQDDKDKLTQAKAANNAVSQAQNVIGDARKKQLEAQEKLAEIEAKLKKPKTLEKTPLVSEIDEKIDEIQPSVSPRITTVPKYELRSTDDSTTTKWNNETLDKILKDSLNKYLNSNPEKAISGFEDLSNISVSSVNEKEGTYKVTINFPKPDTADKNAEEKFEENKKKFIEWHIEQTLKDLKEKGQNFIAITEDGTAYFVDAKNEVCTKQNLNEAIKIVKEEALKVKPHDTDANKKSMLKHNFLAHGDGKQPKPANEDKLDSEQNGEASTPSSRATALATADNSSKLISR